ncbi:MAG: 23S rRNA (adenine(2503)-C(2))-methyltransferase RlmN, partial [Proteobacteria bacterium]|nr:23S rRNA (adenine(2503)-C(2))-methyltransferase RlmN [Pseudomonadota bacterium]
GHNCVQILKTRYDCRQIEIVDEIHADDGTTRIIYELSDGARIETVHMPREVKSPRVTLCISSQVGCAMNCAFCATATLGLRRNLTAGEIVQQVSLALYKFGPHKCHAVNIVFMGMGEALMNTDNVIKAIDILTNEHGLNIPPVRITLSTSGVLSELPKLKAAPNRPNIAISINATTDEIRSQIMPVNRRFPLAEIRKALLEWPYRSHEKVLLEYVLLEGINDTPEDAQRLADFAKDLPHNINIIPYNETPRDRFHAPTTETIQRFIKDLQDRGCLVTLRVARGAQVGGACGQLLAKRAGLQ